MPTARKPQPPASFEAALERIEQIAARMEAGELPLEDLINAYEEGVGLLRYCTERLSVVEKRLQVLTRDASGQLQGLADMPEQALNQHSTPPGSSATSDDSPSPADDAARLF